MVALATEILQRTLMITVFVAVMMLLVEYLNVQSRGLFMRVLSASPWRQYAVAVLLGAIPGCLGAYVVVALWMHRKVSLGALVAAMIATSGDETFVMLALFPGTAALITLGLSALGVATGWLTDHLVPAGFVSGAPGCCDFDLHEEEEECRCFPRGKILSLWRPPSAHRATLVVGLALAVLALVSGTIGPADWGWKRVTLVGVMAVGLFIASTVPDHFLDAHLWRHVALHHVPRLFLWTGAALAVLTVANQFVDLASLISNNPWPTLGISALVGILPESGPHLAFVTAYSDGILPLAVLVTSSAVQDGHGMLPLLAANKRAFVVVKLINVVAGVSVGAVMLLLM